MAWAKPVYTKGEIDAAGKRLIGFQPSNPQEWELWDQTLTVINNWRSAHSYPLLSMRMTLTGRAKKVDDRAIIAQRLKRMFSIAVKLVRNEHMALSQMQDLGGCRAVVRNVRTVHKLVRVYEASIAKSPNVRAQLVKKYDYIASPKADGYRSVHFVFKYRTQSKKHQAWSGLRIELQIRSRLQHAWATAVETVDTFTKQTLKTGGGMDPWRRFFLLMSSVIALVEGSPTCKDCPQTKEEIRSELKALATSLNVKGVLRGWSQAMTYLPTRISETGGTNYVYLLYLDAQDEKVKITVFPSEEQAKASEVYLSTEKMISARPGAQAVLVSVNSLQALKSAFPNYFADTRVFVDAVNQGLSGRFPAPTPLLSGS